MTLTVEEGSSILIMISDWKEKTFLIKPSNKHNETWRSNLHIMCCQFCHATASLTCVLAEWTCISHKSLDTTAAWSQFCNYDSWLYQGSCLFENSGKILRFAILFCSWGQMRQSGSWTSMIIHWWYENDWQMSQEHSKGRDSVMLQDFSTLSQKATHPGETRTWDEVFILWRMTSLPECIKIFKIDVRSSLSLQAIHGIGLAASLQILEWSLFAMREHAMQCKARSCFYCLVY